MKCPKCGYLGFEAVERCRNCGYDFSLAEPVAEQDALLRLPEDTHAPEDLALIDAAAADAGRPTPGPLAFRPKSDQWVDDHRTSPELPLFEAEDAHQPLVARARVPRPPLAVRRATPDVPRARAAAPRMPMLDLAASDFEVPIDAFAPRPAYRPAAEPTPSRPDVAAAEAPEPLEPFEIATIGSRIAAVAFDVLVLAVIDAVVVYFTMQICGLTFDELAILPRAPLVAFLILQNGGYWVAFTIGGQTLGKMAAGIRVVSTRSNLPLDFGHAVLRTCVWAILAVPAGLGFLTALFSADHRGLHDRLAGTKVVRAAA